MAHRPDPVAWRWLGRVAYAEAIALLERTRERVLAGDRTAQQLFLCEHPPVITLGRSADDSHVLLPAAELAARGIAVVRASRGGDVTYHGPGQLMVYPVVRLTGGVVEFLEAVAGALAQVAAHFGAAGASWQRDPAGLWLSGAKLAACGIHLRRRVTLHGFSFNVATPADRWDAIVPCGLHQARVTSLAELLAPAAAPSIEQVARVAAPRITRALRHAGVGVRGAAGI